MNVDFTPQQQPFVQRAIESGRLRRSEDAAHEAFCLWVEREKAKAQNRPTPDQADCSAAGEKIRQYEMPIRSELSKASELTRAPAESNGESTELAFAMVLESHFTGQPEVIHLTGNALGFKVRDAD